MHMCSHNATINGTHRGEGKGMPLEEGHRRNVDKDILTSLGKETFPPHLNLKRFGRVLHHLHNNHITQTTNESNYALYYVYDQSTQHVLPRLCACLCVCTGGGLVECNVK